MLNETVPVEARHAIHTSEPYGADLMTWTWRFNDWRLSLRLIATGARMEARAHSSYSGLGVQITLVRPAPMTATQIWALLVLAGLLPERSRG